MPAQINPTKIEGPWQDGYVLDRHVISSIPTGDPYYPFDTKRTELGELLYQFKYAGKMDMLEPIVDVMEDFVRNRWQRPTILDFIVPAPPSITRSAQPVLALARELARRLGLRTCEDAFVKVKPTPPMKNISRPERRKILDAAIQKGAGDIRGKSVLLLDDLTESGSTLCRGAEVLLNDGGASSVYVLALTRTK